MLPKTPPADMPSAQHCGVTKVAGSRQVAGSDAAFLSATDGAGAGFGGRSCGSTWCAGSGAVSPSVTSAVAVAFGAMEAVAMSAVVSADAVETGDAGMLLVSAVGEVVVTAACSTEDDGSVDVAPPLDFAPIDTATSELGRVGSSTDDPPPLPLPLVEEEMDVNIARATKAKTPVTAAIGDGWVRRNEPSASRDACAAAAWGMGTTQYHSGR